MASKAIHSNPFRDMRPLLGHPLPEVAHSLRSTSELDPEVMSVDSWEPEGWESALDLYELSMVPEHLTMDLPIQITIFVYAYAKLP